MKIFAQFFSELSLRDFVIVLKRTDDLERK